jgi:hypothetical protein
MHELVSFGLVQIVTERCGPAPSIGNPRSVVPPPEKKRSLVGTKLPL